MRHILSRIWILVVYLYLVIDNAFKIAYTFFSERSNEAKVLAILVLALIVSKLWTRYPESDILHDDLILITKQPLTLRMHYYFIFSILSSIIALSALYVVFKKYRWAVHCIVILFILDLADYKIMYGEPLIYYKDYPIEYGLIKGISMVFICVIVFIKEIYLVKKI